jgi:hypothetical protein
MRRFALIILVVFADAFFPAGVRAQGDPDKPSAVWLSGGVGGGWTRVSCAICRVQRNLGPTGYLRVGVPLQSGIVIGAEANVWTHEREDVREWTRSLSAVAYMNPRGALFLKAGAGQLSYQAEEDLTANMLGVQLGGGYEFKVGRSLYITNHLNLLAGSYGSLRSEGAQVVDDVSVTLVQLGIGLTRR